MNRSAPLLVLLVHEWVQLSVPRMVHLLARLWALLRVLLTGVRL